MILNAFEIILLPTYIVNSLNWGQFINAGQFFFTQEGKSWNNSGMILPKDAGITIGRNILSTRKFQGKWEQKGHRNQRTIVEHTWTSYEKSGLREINTHKRYLKEAELREISSDISGKFVWVDGRTWTKRDGGNTIESGWEHRRSFKDNGNNTWYCNSSRNKNNGSF